MASIEQSFPFARCATPHQVLAAGGVAGSVSWAIIYPLDVVKARLQTQTQGQYTGMVDCFRKSVQAEGWRSLTKVRP